MQKTENASFESEGLDTLLVIDKFEVGPVKVENNRIIAPYKVWQDGKTDSIDLIYKYEEAVFDINAHDSKNLAEMITAQVALNYGLFCKEDSKHLKIRRVGRSYQGVKRKRGKNVGYNDQESG